MGVLNMFPPQPKKQINAQTEKFGGFLIRKQKAFFKNTYFPFNKAIWKGPLGEKKKPLKQNRVDKFVVLLFFLGPARLD